MTPTAAAPLASSDRKVDRLLTHYEESHRNPTNELIHFVAIPAIMLSIVGLLFAVHPWVAYGFVAASLVYYALLRAPAFLLTMLLLTALALAAGACDGRTCIADFSRYLCGGVGLPVRGPQDRRQETFVLRRHPISVGRPAVRAVQAFSKAGHTLVAKDYSRDRNSREPWA